jgi:nucleoside permease NupC
VLGGADPPFAVTNPSGMVNFAFGILSLVIVISMLPVGALDPRSMTIVVCALCGFANFSLVGADVAALAALHARVVSCPIRSRNALCS